MTRAVLTFRSMMILGALGTLLPACEAESTDGASTGGAGGTTGGNGGSGGATGGKGGAGGASSGGAGGTAGTGGTGGNAAGSGGQATAGSSSGGTATVACSTPPSAAPASTWVNATGNLANMASECGNLGLVSAQPCSNRIIAGIAQKGLWESVDGGQTWTQMGKGAGSAVITNRISAIVYDPADPNIFWESGIYNGGGIYKTTNSGSTFTQLGTITHNDSLSVDLSDPERKTLIAGSHETSATLHKSTDGGATWSNIASGLPSAQCTGTQIVDSMTFLVGCNNGTIQRSTTGGGGWTTAPGSTLGGVFQPLMASDDTIYWPGASGGIMKSTDGGANFTTSAPSGTAPGIVAPAQLAELPDGRIAIIGTDHILLSGDHGATWNPIGDAMPYPGGGYDGARGVAYSAQTKTFFIWRWDCANTVPANGIMSMGFDWETQ